MVLSTLKVESYTPRGGSEGTSVAVVGSGFGAAAGRAVFDPLGFAVEATVDSWAPNSITLTVPTLDVSLLDGFVDVLIEDQAQNDSDVIKFWVPAAVPSGGDYQLPAFDDQDPNTDVPTRSQAADHNRLLDAAQGGGGLGDCGACLDRILTDENGNVLSDENGNVLYEEE